MYRRCLRRCSTRSRSFTGVCVPSHSRLHATMLADSPCPGLQLDDRHVLLHCAGAGLVLQTRTVCSCQKRGRGLHATSLLETSQLWRTDGDATPSARCCGSSEMCKMKGTGLLTLTTHPRRLQLAQEATPHCASMLPCTSKPRVPPAEYGSELLQGRLHLTIAVPGLSNARGYSNVASRPRLPYVASLPLESCAICRALLESCAESRARGVRDGWHPWQMSCACVHSGHYRVKKLAHSCAPGREALRM